MRASRLLAPSSLLFLVACSAPPTSSQIANASSAAGDTTAPAGVAGTVTGRVFLRGAPARAQVLIDGQVITTNVDGQFSVPAVAGTYEVAVAVSSGAVVYEGMTTRSPVFAISPQSGSEAAELPLSLPSEPDATHRVTIAATANSPNVTPFAFGLGSDASSTIAIGPVGASLVLHALAFDADPDTGAPTQWTGHDQVALTDVEGTAPAWSVALAPVPNASLTVRPRAPASTPLGSVSLFLHGGDAPVVTLTGRESASDVAFTTPSVAGLSLDVVATAASESGVSGAAAMGLAPDAQGTSIAVPPIPASQSPAHGASVDARAPFSFTPAGAAAHWVTFASRGADGYVVQVVTMAATVSMPDLTSLGHSLAPGASFDWWVTQNGMEPSVDAAAAAGLVVFDGKGAANEVSSYGESTKREVTFRAAAQ